MTDNLKERITAIKQENIDLDVQRNIVQEIDEEICILLAERQDATLKIGVYKSTKKIKPEDEDDENSQNTLLSRNATRYHLNEACLVSIWDIIRNESKIMNNIIKRLL